MTKKEINLKIDKNDKVLIACEDSLLNIGIILNSLKLLKKPLRKIYPSNEASKEFSETMLAITADITSIKSEVEDVASDTADETVELKRQLENLDGVQE